MARSDASTAPFLDSTNAEIEKIKDELRALAPNKRALIAQRFADLYPVIEEMKLKNVTQKSILLVLEKNGLKLHPARFNKLMAEVKKQSIQS